VCVCVCVCQLYLFMSDLIFGYRCVSDFRKNLERISDAILLANQPLPLIYSNMAVIRTRVVGTTLAKYSV